MSATIFLPPKHEVEPRSPTPGEERNPEDPLCRTLAELYRAQRALEPGNRYLAAHASAKFIATQVRLFRWYAGYLPEAGAVLDWGCQHAPDSCLLRAAYGERFRLRSCDFVAPGRFQAFADFARSEYKQLDHISKLPYEDGCFDAIIASGVLEHTAMDYEALKELYRILRQDGVLVITYLPNRWSYEEWYRRVVAGHDFHQRLYSLRSSVELLKHSGFLPLDRGYHWFLADKLAARLGNGPWARRAASFANLVPIKPFVSTLRFVARKVTVF